MQAEPDRADADGGRYPGRYPYGVRRGDRGHIDGRSIVDGRRGIAATPPIARCRDDDDMRVQSALR